MKDAVNKTMTVIKRAVKPAIEAHEILSLYTSSALEGEKMKAQYRASKQKLQLEQKLKSKLKLAAARTAVYKLEKEYEIEKLQLNTKELQLKIQELKASGQIPEEKPTPEKKDKPKFNPDDWISEATEDIKFF